MAGEARRRRVRALLETAGVRLRGSREAKDDDLARFDAAFVHESAFRERLAAQSNERLEFLGDAILGFIVAEDLVRRYPRADEGELTLRKHALVRDEALVATAQRLGFEPLLVLGSGLGAAPAETRRSLLADAFEAFLAVLHREAGLGAVTAFVLREHVAYVERTPLAGDPKNVLQEWSQRRFGATPVYASRAEGPDQRRIFHADVSVEGDTLASGSGASKKEAERAAAAAALTVVQARHGDVTLRTLSEPEPESKPARAVKRRPGAATARVRP